MSPTSKRKDSQPSILAYAPLPARDAGIGSKHEIVHRRGFRGVPRTELTARASPIIDDLDRTSALKVPQNPPVACGGRRQHAQV